MGVIHTSAGLYYFSLAAEKTGQQRADLLCEGPLNTVLGWKALFLGWFLCLFVVCVFVFLFHLGTGS